MSKIKDFSELSKLIEKLGGDIKETLRDKRVLNEIGEEAVDDIVKRTRLGYGVEKNGDKKGKLKPLSESYKEQRKEERKEGRLSTATSPSKSNLTRTGAMLDDLYHEVEEDGVTIRFKSKFSDVKAAKVSRSRPFLNLSDLQVKRITRKVGDLIKSILKPSK